MKAILRLIFSILAFLGFRQNEPEVVTPTHQTSLSGTKKQIKTVPARRCDRVQTSPNWLKLALNSK